jgi:hypothetical protein
MSSTKDKNNINEPMDRSKQNPEHRQREENIGNKERIEQKPQEKGKDEAAKVGQQGGQTAK